MPLFICSDCGCIDNTALGDYWSRWNKGEKPLCCECTDKPPEWGVIAPYGKWHNKFSKELWDGKTEVKNPEDFPKHLPHPNVKPPD